MVYDDETGPLIRLTLPLPDVQELADRVTDPPAPEIENLIVQFAIDRAERLAGLEVDPYLLQDDLYEDNIDVSLEQIAWVLLTRLRVMP